MWSLDTFCVAEHHAPCVLRCPISPARGRCLETSLAAGLQLRIAGIAFKLGRWRTGEHMHTREMIASHPDVRGNVNQSLLAAIDEAYACAQACTSCADACLAEEMVAQLRQCIRLNLDCADVCAATATVGSRRTGSDEEVIRKMLDACAAACRLCGEECQRHASKHEHCRICADACRTCESACQEALRTL